MNPIKRDDFLNVIFFTETVWDMDWGQPFEDEILHDIQENLRWLMVIPEFQNASINHSF